MLVLNDTDGGAREMMMVDGCVGSQRLVRLSKLSKVHVHRVVKCTFLAVQLPESQSTNVTPLSERGSLTTKSHTSFALSAGAPSPPLSAPLSLRREHPFQHTARDQLLQKKVVDLVSLFFFSFLSTLTSTATAILDEAIPSPRWI